MLSARCEKDLVTSLLWDSLLMKARRRRLAVNLFLALLIYKPFLTDAVQYKYSQNLALKG